MEILNIFSKYTHMMYIFSNSYSECLCSCPHNVISLLVVLHDASFLYVRGFIIVM